VTRRVLGGVALAALAAIWAVSIYLLWQSKEPTLTLPHVDVSALFPAPLLRRVDRYDQIASLIGLAGLLIELVVFAVYARLGPGFTRESAAGPLGTGMLLGMIGFGLLWVAELPATVVELWWDRRHGLTHGSYVQAVLGGWLQLGFEFVLLCVTLAIVMGLARLLGHWWWAVAAPVFVGVALLFAFVSPWLQPTHPVDDPALQATVRQLEAKARVGRVPVRIQDVSSDTSLPNAETEGIGPSRRVVIWDTLLDGRFTPGEIRVVIAHELGHVKRNHIWKSVAWYALFAFPGAYIISRVTRRRGGMGEPAAVPLALLTLVVLQLLALPLQNVISRHMESEADWLALQTTHDPSSAKALFKAFVRTAYSNPNPPTWEYLLDADHPTIAQRIAMVEAWQAYYAAPASTSRSGSTDQEP
jgi:STE24 endopeptidase